MTCIFQKKLLRIRRYCSIFEQRKFVVPAAVLLFKRRTVHENGVRGWLCIFPETFLIILPTLRTVYVARVIV